jgi:hypothetical protein
MGTCSSLMNAPVQALLPSKPKAAAESKQEAALTQSPAAPVIAPSEPEVCDFVCLCMHLLARPCLPSVPWEDGDIREKRKKGFRDTE